MQDNFYSSTSQKFFPSETKLKDLIACKFNYTTKIYYNYFHGTWCLVFQLQPLLTEVMSTQWNYISLDQYCTIKSLTIFRYGLGNYVFIIRKITGVNFILYFYTMHELWSPINWENSVTYINAIYKLLERFRLDLILGSVVQLYEIQFCSLPVKCDYYFTRRWCKRKWKSYKEA